MRRDDKDVWLTGDSCSIEEFANEVEVETTAMDYPLTDDIRGNVPHYDAAKIVRVLDDTRAVAAYMAEWHRIFLDGPGVVVFRGNYPDGALIDKVSAVLMQIIEDERGSSGSKGDHFAKAGANARVWNSHEKLCMLAPELYSRYASNGILDLVSRSWLGPLYQITAQVNLVYPGGAAQSPHRDYHMGFLQQHQLQHYPAHVHWLSAALTLQGAIAHCDMPVESGPTKILPYSQRYLPGYFATHRSEFRAYFEAHYAQVPLAKGDAMFFNPALFHAAGSNTTASVNRLANLLQIGSGFGRSIEIVDRARMTKHLYPTLCAMRDAGLLSARDIANLVAATAEGYPFPCNLDVDSPLSGMAPSSQQDILTKALAEKWPASELSAAIDGYVARRTSH